MKKQLLIIGIIVLLVFVGLSGCNKSNQSNDKNKFIGTWEYVNNTYFTMRYIFYENDTVVQTSSMTNPMMNISNWYNYEVNDGEICFEFIQTKASGCMPYSFSEDYTLLTFGSTDEPGNSTVYRKIS